MVNMINTTLFISLMLQILIGVISYFIILTIMRDEFIIGIIERVKNNKPRKEN